jgi:hypothetical protein
MQLIPECTFADYNNHLGDCLRIFAGSPHYDYINWRWEAVQDKISGEKTCLKEIQGFKQKIIYLLIRYFIPKKFLIS